MAAPTPGTSQDTVTLTVSSSGTTSTSADISNCSELGLFVPTITSGTVTVQVSEDDSNYFGLVNQAGTAILALAASTGAVAISGNELGACLPYKYIRVVCGASQGSARSFTLKRKWVGGVRV
jgi:hypothetical protein